MDDDYQRYRREMVESVSNKGGSSVAEVAYAILPNGCTILLVLTFLTLIGPEINSQTRIIVEFCFIIIPSVLCCTIYADHALAISQIILIISAANILLILVWKPKDDFKIPAVPQSSNKISCLSYFRAMTNILTCICILAVDFPVFPRKFVKTETFGYSLMDAGVGMFIISNALVAPEARNFEPKSKTLFVPSVITTARGCAPLLALGFIRSISVELLGYQLHVTEYGKHWNFFFTLALVKMFTDILSSSLSSKFSTATGMWIIAMHEYSLTTKGVQDWILSDEPRDDFISANREGMFSVPGYVGLYLVGVGMGRFIHWTYQKVDNQLVLNINSELRVGYTRTMLLTFKFIIITVVLFFISQCLEQHFQPSRRLANSSYCAWIVTLSSWIITLLLINETIMECIVSCKRDKNNQTAKNADAKEVNVVQSLEILEAVNDNGLAFFLFANLFTFALNMAIKTLRTDSQRAVIIIISYMVANITLVLLRYRGQTILRAQKRQN